MMKLKYCVALTVVTFLLLFAELFVLWLPLVGLIQNLSASENVAHVPVPSIWHVLINPLFGLLILAPALASVVGTIVGLRRETGARDGWVVTLVFGVIVLLFAVQLPFALPKLRMLFYDLGIK